ncbi:hypothetical protein [Chryseobacterium wangxinyae]|uniref:hypothetical protein n=1 Tax=Chryseobacterium sp. CY353 TaxID=2997334 RepID=UPI0022701606|nr:hypothetical protein [Chryseobacterium sp. CY353]MCY0969180.1 hypothetical protein [Chryseobacterium sp. CY353]
MITKEQALENVKKYLTERKRDYIFIVNQDKVVYEMQKKIPYGKYEDKIKDIYVVNYDIEGYTENTPHFVAVDVDTGEVLFTMTQHGYAEDWED